jgi:hypothetical protein
MKNKYIIMWLLVITLVFVLVSAIMSNKNNVGDVPQRTFQDSPFPLGPKTEFPIMNAELVSLEEAQERVPFPIPLPTDIKVKKVWASLVDIDASNRSIAIEFNNGLLLIIHQMKTPLNNWDGIIANAQKFYKININGSSGIGRDPGFTENYGKKYRYQGSVTWWVSGLDISLYSDTMSLSELVAVAESIPLPTATETPTLSATEVPTDTPTDMPTIVPTDTPTETTTPTP